MILSYSFSIRVEAELAIRSETRRCANFCMDCQLTEPQLCRQENWKPKTESWKAQISWCFLKSSVTYLPTLFDWQFRCIKSLRIRIPICTKWLHFECMEMYGKVSSFLVEDWTSWGTCSRSCSGGSRQRVRSEVFVRQAASLLETGHLGLKGIGPQGHDRWNRRRGILRISNSLHQTPEACREPSASCNTGIVSTLFKSPSS